MLHAQTSKHSCLLLLRRRSLVGRLLWSLWCRRAVLLLCGLLRCLRHRLLLLLVQRKCLLLLLQCLLLQRKCLLLRCLCRRHFLLLLCRLGTSCCSCLACHYFVLSFLLL